MAASIFLLLTIIILSSSSSSPSSHGLTGGSSLFVENKDDLIVSPNGLFTAGFHQVGENAYVFAVWFTQEAASGAHIMVWMANRDAPVNGKRSKLTLWKDGNLVLIDAGQYIIWSTQTESESSSVQLKLHNTGNLVLQQQQQHTLWQSFDYPTDTLLPNQLFTRNTQLVSSRSSSNHSSGFYKLFFDNDSILRLIYNSPETTSIYWPDPRLRTYLIGRFQYIDSRRASLDSYGQFNSTDGFRFISADFGMGPQRMMRLDTDGNLRVYSLGRGMKWEVQWQAISHIFKIDGTCGPNSLCTYSQDSGKKCSCLHGYKMVNSQDWSYGCEPEFHLRKKEDCGFIELHYTEFYGYDIRFHHNTSLDACKRDCLQDNTCSGFNFAWKADAGYYFCSFKSSLHNGYQMGVNGTMYIKLPKRLVSSFKEKIGFSQSSFSCPQPVVTPLISSKHVSTTKQMYMPASTGFRKFTYSELKKASRNFSEEIGRGGASIVYKARGGGDQWNFSMMRGTRGYMAPEWVLNLPITSKVDVFSYGVVMLEMLTGRSPAHRSNENGEAQPALIDWARDWVQRDCWVEEVIDPSIRGEFDRSTMEELVRIALQCTEEDTEARPTMSQVVNMLFHM
ncbi:hypothetical protein L1987_21573 [Smallanthus sonchifolius]|uniref:Uncharacterized protein n=1 Tax=Smallanthus sonchifolius TaxID=185202 RepID=A0ACB9IWG8_9ASTR|nr:hypothetical protein L1987_21573 [Smallanthus sonchifolius]